MTISKPTENHVNKVRPRYMRLWLILLVGFVFAVSYFYYQQRLAQESFANSNYFRILSETSTKINENLEQLTTLHRNCESEVSIRAIFVSYKESIKNNTELSNKECEEKFGDSSKLSILFKGDKALVRLNGKTILGTVELTDIFPKRTSEFSGYLLVNESNEVIASTESRSGLAITNVDSISKMIHEQQSQNWNNLSSSGSSTVSQDPVSLPGYSHFIDIDLISLDYRVFIYPFLLFKEREVKQDTNLHIIGFLPKSALQAHQNTRWNLSLLSLALVLLLFAWMMARLFMLSNNQPVGQFFYKSIMFSSYLLFVMIFSLLIAFSETTINQQDKRAKAAQLMSSIRTNFAEEMSSIFKELVNYQSYYQDIVKEYDHLKKHPPIESDLTPKHECLVAGKNSIDKIKDLSKYDLSSQKSLIERFHSEADKNNNSKLKGEYYCANLINFYSGGIIPMEERYSERFAPREELLVNHKLLNVTALNAKDGISNLPAFYTIELNRPRVNYNLVHRRYFRDVRDQRGWGEIELGDKENKFKSPNNWYIQRLRNINNGTKGTTLALPVSQEELPKNTQSKHILVADIELASLNMTELVTNETLMDLSFIVIDRDTGDVLFHIDDDRVLIENFYQSGQGTAKIAHRIRSGLGGNLENEKWTDGFYHGVAGQFSYRKMPVKQWALVVFMPDESLTTFMTNTFLLNTITITFFIMLIAFIIVLLRLIPDTGKIKTKLSIPLVIDRRKVMVFTSIFVTSIYLGFWLGLDTQNPDSSVDYYQLIIVSVIGLSCMLWGYFEFRRYYNNSLQAQRNSINIHRGAGLLSVAYIAFGVAMVGYLSTVALTPSKGLSWYYDKNVYPARLVQERNEIHKIALTRFPNSISQFGVDPLSLMPISSQWRDVLAKSQQKKPFLQPGDVASYSKLIYTSDMQSWLSRFLVNRKRWPFTQESSVVSTSTDSATLDPDTNYKSILYVALMLISYLGLCYVWLLFNRKILSLRLYGPSNFLRHLNQTVNRCENEQVFKPRTGLLIDLIDKPTGGVNIDLLIERWHLNRNTVSDSVAKLFEMTPLIANICERKEALPNLKIAVKEYDEKVAVEIWGFKTILESSVQRSILLSLINQFKSLQFAGELCSLTMYSGFQNIKRQFLKQSHLNFNEPSEQHSLNTEYLQWAECFKDFSVRLPEVQNKNLDLDFIQQEIKVCPWLKFIGDELAINDRAMSSSFNFMRWLTLKESNKTQAEWTSLSHILSKVEALYRFKWESCSEKEKLTLYYLVTNKRVNPANLHMLEQLTRKGLIMVKRGRVHIINKSFAHFINQAENKETIQKMVEQGNLGMWQNYRLPVTLLVLLIIGGIALMSGNSLYMIVASIMGVLGTISSLTNSANLIRNNLK
jgi:hypothetical protein